MHTLVIASRKGGAGKTTLAGHLAVAAVQAGEGPVAIIDTDEQGTLSEWWNQRKAEEPLFAKVEIGSLQSHLKSLNKQGIKLAIIDTAPGMNSEAKAALEAILPSADLVLTPLRASPHDLRAVGGTIELVEAAGKRMIFVINGAANRAKITGDAAISLSQHGTVAPVIVYQRTDFATSMIDGRTVQEIEPKGKSAEEVRGLWKYVSTQLRK